jgi:tyrosine-protein phosphatase SIW14
VISQVDAVLYRGPRPPPQDYPYVKALFKSIISLEGLAEDEKEMVALSPIPVISWPISFKQIYFTGITQQDLATILLEISAAPKPLLVHCQHGQDRTGLICAAYRVRVWRWSKVEAMAEAVSFGYRGWPLNIGLNKTWSQFA